MKNITKVFIITIVALMISSLSITMAASSPSLEKPKYTIGTGGPVTPAKEYVIGTGGPVTPAKEYVIGTGGPVTPAKEYVIGTGGPVTPTKEYVIEMGLININYNAEDDQVLFTFVVDIPNIGMFECKAVANEFKHNSEQDTVNSEKFMKYIKSQK
jgi:hypothetical protein